MHAVTADLPRAAGDLLAKLRKRAPRVHCITNNVAQAFTANLLLAAGCVPSMTISPAEIGAFVEGAHALLVNLGTFDGERREAAHIAIDVIRHRGKPWVLDPVLIDRSEARAGFAKALLARKPAAVRLNAAEFKALGCTPDRDGAILFAKEAGTVVALSGATDIVAGSGQVAALANGHPHMARVTALGCAASALTAAFIACGEDDWSSSAAALLTLGVAGEVAGEKARGPGSFAVEILDALYNLDAAAIAQRAKVS